VNVPFASGVRVPALTPVPLATPKSAGLRNSAWLPVLCFACREVRRKRSKRTKSQRAKRRRTEEVTFRLSRISLMRGADRARWPIKGKMAK
jgi:hypothetical protein